MIKNDILEIPDKFLLTKLLTAYEKLTYLAIKYYADRYNDGIYAEVTIEKINSITGLSRYTTCEIIKALEKKGCIKKIRRGLTQSNIYVIANNADIWDASTLNEMIDIGTDIISPIVDELFGKPQKDEQVKQVKTKQESGYIYVMKCMGVYKIGRSINKKRLGEYTHLPEEPYYEVLEYVDDCYSLEKFLHNKYNRHRTRDNCEWFKLGKDDLREIKTIVNEHII